MYKFISIVQQANGNHSIQTLKFKSNRKEKRSELFQVEKRPTEPKAKWGLKKYLREQSVRRTAEQF